MEYSIRSLHKLPVLNWDEFSNKRNDFETIPGDIVNYTDYKRNSKKNESKTEKIDVKYSKHKLHRKSASNKKLKETLSICSNYVKRLLYPSNTALSTRKYKKRRAPNREINQIKVIFSSEARKLKNKLSNVNLNVIDGKSDLKANNYCDSLEDIFNPSLMNIKNRQNVYSCEMPKRITQNNSKANNLKKHNFNHLHKLSPKLSSRYGISSQYKVVQFPNYDQTDTELEEINMGRIDEINNNELNSNNAIDLQTETQVAACKLSISNEFSKRGGGDGCAVGIQCEAPKKGVKCKRKLYYDPCFDSLFDPFKIHENVLNVAKILLKYLVFGLALIVWCPCIITTYFCWFITYPFRPRYTRTNGASNSCLRRKSQVKIYECGNKHIIDESIQTCGNNPWSFLLKGISQANNSIAFTFKAFKSLLDSDIKNVRCHPNSDNERTGYKNHIITSDPKKKYTLYYSRNKGWVMKSVKLHPMKNINIRHNLKEDPHMCNSNCVKQNVDRPIQNSQARTLKGEIIDKNKKSSEPNFNYDRSKNLCVDNSDLPVRVKLLNPKSKNNLSCTRHNGKPGNKNYQLVRQRHLACKKKRYKTCSHCKGSKTSKFKKVLCRYYCKIKSVINDAETEAFENCNMGREESWFGTLQRRARFCVYNNCPSFYPVYIETHRFYVNMCHAFLLLLSACIWCPLIAFCYLSYAIILRCL